MAEPVAIGTVAFDMVYRILGAVVIVVFSVAIFYGYRYFTKNSKKAKQFKISAVIINRNGTVALDKLAFLKSEDQMLQMEFQKRTQDTIPPLPYKFLRNNQCILFNYAPGQYAPIDPLTWECVDLKRFNIQLLNNNMKNFAMLEQRAAVGRWARKQDAMKQLTPWITMGVVAIAVCVMAWFMLKTATSMYTTSTSNRFAECEAIMPKYNPPVPTGPSTVTS